MASSTNGSRTAAVCPAVSGLCCGAEAGDVNLMKCAVHLTEIVYTFVIRLNLTAGKVAGIVPTKKTKNPHLL
jgi:hypothetical protein